MGRRIRSNEDAVTDYLETLQLNERGEVLAQIAISLARAMDETENATSGAVAQAVPSMAKELRATLEEIAATVETADDFLDRLNT